MNFVEGNSGSDAGDVFSLTNSLVAAAHELKTPLVLIRQLTFQLEQESPVAFDSLSDEPRKSRETIERLRLTTERTLRLVDNLTKAVRLDDAMFSLEPVILNSLCQEAADEMTPLAHANNLKIKVKSPRKNIVAVANRDIVRMLLVGLCDNAIHYSGGKIEMNAKISQGKAMVSVRDYGATLDIADFRRLSRNLGTATHPLSARPLSSGLGLLIAEKFTKAMNGQLSMERHARGGLTFSISLPASRQLSLLEL
jgi:signal transduction histidine kinase